MSVIAITIEPWTVTKKHLKFGVQNDGKQKQMNTVKVTKHQQRMTQTLKVKLSKKKFEKALNVKRREQEDFIFTCL